MELRSERIFVAGHRGLAGSAIVRALQSAGCTDIILRTRQEVDLQDQATVRLFFAETRPSVVILAAGRVGGIGANAASPASFIADNLQIKTNVITESHAAGVQHLLLLASSCAYPKHCTQPITEDALLSGPLEPTNAPYAIANIAGISLCQAMNAQYGRRYVSVMPTNLYGPGDTFDLQTSHVLPALILRLHLAKKNNAARVTLWGTGKPLREFLYVDDLAAACLHVLQHPGTADVYNIGSGSDLSIAELGAMVAKTVGFGGDIIFDHTMPDGTPRKLLNSDRMRSLGWSPKTDLEEGLAKTYAWFLQNEQSLVVA